MLVLEIAGGILLAAVVLCAWRFILAYIFACIAGYAAVVLAFLVLDAVLGDAGLRMLARLVLDVLGYGILILGIVGVVYSWFKPKEPEPQWVPKEPETPEYFKPLVRGAKVMAQTEAAPHD